MVKKLVPAVLALGTGVAVHAADWLTQQFSYSTFDLNGVAVTFTPEGPSLEETTNYTISAETITELPVNLDDVPNETYLTMNDDSVQIVPFEYGYVPYFGTYYVRMRIGSNGYITFNQSDGDFTPSLTDHFDLDRISLFWDDLYPPAGGEISWARVSDPERYVITYDNVPHIGNTNYTVTAQCEFFLDDGRVRLSWIDTDCIGYTIIGLSVAQGYNSANYVDTDFSSYLVTADDIDEDGISDTWETTYFGSYGACNPTNDFDLDGFSNLQEYIAGTLPKDNTSYFRITSMYLNSTDMILNWNAVQGRLYSVKWTDSLGSAFSSVATGLSYPLNSYTSTVSSAEGYYTVEVELAP